MPKKEREQTSEDLRRDERRIGKNIPKAAIGEGDGDVRDVELHED